MNLYPTAPIIKKEGATMPEEKKSRYTEAQARSAKKYLTETVEDVRIRVPKGQKAVIKAHAESQGESMNQFVIRAIHETMEREGGSVPPAPEPKAARSAPASPERKP